METKTTIVRASDGRELCVESGGDTSGRPVLVHNGTPNSRHLFGRWLADAEQRGIHLVGYDRPGYGRSTPEPGRSVASCTNDVRTIADAFGFDRLAVWGMSGGGPHALACAAVLSDLVCAVSSLASPAPYGESGFDYFAGMGELNADAVKLFLKDRDAARRKGAEDREELLHVTPEQLKEAWASLLSPVDLATLTDDLISFLVASMKDGLAPGDQGWWDDGCAEMAPWGFKFAEIQIPVQLWHGKHDKAVPFQHGQWLANQIPGVDAHLSDTDGHLSLVDRVPDVHGWLLQYF